MRKLLLLFVVVLLPMVAMAAVEIDGINYNLDSNTNTASVTSKTDKYTGDVVIPPTVIYNNVEYSVTRIMDAFNGCTGLTSVSIPNSVTYIGSGSFYNCTKLTSITIPNSVTRIGASAFLNCKGLSSLNIPNGVATIGASAFDSCSGLTTITIPPSVTSINVSAFASCPRITTIYCLNPTPTSCLGNDTFVDESGTLRDKNDVYNYAVLHVPKGSGEAYASAFEWRYFKNIKEDIETGIAEVGTQKKETNKEIYDLQGRKVQNPRNGLYIIDGEKVVIK